MHILGNLDDGNKILSEYVEAYKLTLIENEFYYIYKITYLILQRIKEIKEKTFTKEEFIKILRNSKLAFNVLNDYTKEKGNKLISKRIKLLEIYLNKYLLCEGIPPNIENYFNNITDIKLPTVENVLTIFKHYSQALINEVEKNNTISKEITNALIYDIFNIKKFKSDLKYNEIGLNKYNSIYYNRTTRNKRVYYFK